MRGEVHASAERCLEGRHVISPGSFPRDPVVLHDSILSGGDLGYGIGEIAPLPFVCLDDRALRVGADGDQGARVVRGIRDGFVMDFDRLLEHRSGPYVKILHVPEKGSVQGHEGIGLGSVLAEVEACCFRECLESPAMVKVRKVSASDGSYVCEAPLFVARRREPNLREALKRLFAQLLDPVRRGRLPAKLLRPPADLFGCHSHTLPTASCSSYMPKPA